MDYYVNSETHGVWYAPEHRADRGHELQCWTRVREWLTTRDAHLFLDEAVLGGLPKWEAEELLVDYGIEATPENLKQLGREVNAALAQGN